MHCKSCGAHHSPTDKFCSECGVRLPVSQLPTNPAFDADASKVDGSKSSSKTKSVFLVLLIALLVSIPLGFLLPESSNQQDSAQPETSTSANGGTVESSTPRETYTRPLNIDEVIGMPITEVPISDEICAEFSQAIARDGIFGRAEERIEEMSEPKTAYEAYDFIQDRSNSYVGAAANVDPDDRVTYQSEILFQELMANSEWRWSASFESQDPGLFNTFTGAVKSRVLTGCSLNSDYGEALEFHEKAVELQQLASRKPWFPEGFTQYPGDSQIAYMWADRRCSYSSARCAHLDVVTKSGASNLYVEVTFTDRDGSYVDWSNDTARALRAGQIAKLEFVSFDSAVRSVQLAEITTY